VSVRYFDNTRENLLGYVPENVCAVVELGCGAGVFGAELKRLRSCRVDGLELDPDAAREAADRLDSVVVGKVEEHLDSLPLERCDLLVCNDLLEHLPQPEIVLDAFRRRAPASAHLLFSVPNVRYVEVVGELLLKRDWKYREHGVLDRTHLRFFTRKSFRRLLEDQGLEVVRDGFSTSCRNLPFRLLDRLLLGSLREFRYMQYVGLARPKV
jgi:SAM-dependent methyltransferase